MNNNTANISILTLVHQRESALMNMLNGIANGSILPCEVLIIFMNEKVIDNLAQQFPFPIRSMVLETKDGLNLGAARNLAMQQSTGSYHVFLDVDCIPQHDFLESYLAHFQANSNVLYTGRVRYLSEGFDQENNWTTRLAEISKPDPVREHLEQYSYELFWSLNFGCTKEIFDKIGGFDIQYTGYGGEDTDFAFQARAHGVPLHTIPALAFHQYHASYQPPLNHLANICQNATRFFGKWHKWPMEGWLHAFEKLGYIRRSDGGLEILSLPSDEEIIAALKRT
ncbi:MULTISPECIES: glycosyltransferase family 2 protein [Sphingobacterium]|uniref:Glycosyltransferase family 2 protein n=1 Tax=Sphingobacterium populi TaxID=1812824 RepID=A0ABW5UG16_9SPHI|nr:glycosyltransferase [Sphingobacterium sp. CFCC 11742]